MKKYPRDFVDWNGRPLQDSEIQDLIDGVEKRMKEKPEIIVASSTGDTCVMGWAGEIRVLRTLKVESKFNL